MVDESNLHEVELLTKRFRDYIDKVQVMLEGSGVATPDTDSQNEPDGSEKLYTVITPADAMAVNLQSVLTTLEKAIRNIEDISGLSSEKPATVPLKTEVVATDSDSSGSEGGKQLFSLEELEFIKKTFHKIINASIKERRRIFESLAKTGEL